MHQPAKTAQMTVRDVLQVPCDEAGQDECPDDQAPDDPGTYPAGRCARRDEVRDANTTVELR